MKSRFTNLLMFILMLIGLGGCGGGGGGSSSALTGITVIKGTASKGIIYPGVVKVYEVKPDGTRGALLSTVPTATDGTYSATLGSYSGAIQVEASGTYTDEATGQEVSIDQAKPLHALVEHVDYLYSNNRVVAVTPLTEVSWRNASANGTASTPPATIASSNSLVTDLFKVNDITSVEPVHLDTSTMTAASQDAQAYTLACASISQMATTATGTTHVERLDDVLNTLATEVKSAETSGSMSTSTTTDFSSALDSISLSSDYPSAKDQLANVGTKSQKLTLSISGTLPAGKRIYTIEGSVLLPANATLRTNSEGKTLSGVLELLPAASEQGEDPMASYLPSQRRLDFSVQFKSGYGGFGTGDFAALMYDIVSGTTVTTADFSIINGSVHLKDASGADISGVLLTLQ